MSPFLILLAACAGGDEVTEPVATPPAADVAVPEMATNDLLTRISLDLRGTRPTVEEVEAVEADASALDALIEDYLADPRFEDQVLSIFAEYYLTRADYFQQSAYASDVADPNFIASIGEEPLRIVAQVITQDLPWTDVVTGDWTMANEYTASIWQTDYPDGETGWQQARYTDGRPAAGVLASTGLWWRYTSTDSNANRKRANIVSRVLLCNDYLVRPIDFDRDVDLLDEEAVQDAILNNPSCANCHNSLDPIASYLFGFWSYAVGSVADDGVYHPERENLWEDYTEVAPAFYGVPGDSLSDLGHQIAGDSRFPACVVEQVYRGLLRRDLTLDDTDALTAHREALLAGDLRVKEVFRSVLTDPNYRAAQTDIDGAVSTKMLTTDQLASSVEDLTGFRWSYYDYPMMHTDTYGVRTLAGGADGNTVTRYASGPNATILLVQERLAEAAASYAVASDLASGAAGALLFGQVDLAAEIVDGDADAIAQIQDLHLRVFGDRVDADGEEVAANMALLLDLQDVTEDPTEAWAGLLTALMRDPDFLFY